MIALISHARSGSTYLMRRLERFRAFRVYFEIFHFNDHIILESLSDDAARVVGALGVKLSSSEPAALRQEVIDHLPLYLDTLELIDPNISPLFKIFPHHLDPPNLQYVIGRCSGLMFLTRNLLHAFISARIAARLNDYSYIDTSQVKVEFSIESFLSFALDCLDHHDSALVMARDAGVQAVHIRYEDLLEAHDIDAFLAPHVDCLSHRKWQGRVVLDSDMRKQDGRQNALEKVSNPHVLEAFVQETSLQSLLDSRAPCDYALMNARLRGFNP